MTEGAERTDTKVPAPAIGPERRAMRIAKGIVLAALMGLVVAGIFAAPGLMPVVGATVLTVLFWLSVFGAVINTVQLLVRARVPRDQRNTECGMGT